jgi:hypothetical protein
LDRDVRVEPEGWGFIYPENEVQIGFSLWAASKFTNFPSREFVSNIELGWYEDMMTMFALYQKRETEERDKKK